MKKVTKFLMFVLRTATLYQDKRKVPGTVYKKPKNSHSKLLSENFRVCLLKSSEEGQKSSVISVIKTEKLVSYPVLDATLETSLSAN